MPKRILIISDMQFDVACSTNNTNYSVLKNKFKSYDLPHICFLEYFRKILMIFQLQLY